MLITMYSSGLESALAAKEEKSLMNDFSLSIVTLVVNVRVGISEICWIFWLASETGVERKI